MGLVMDAVILNSKIEGLADSCIQWVIGSHQGNRARIKF